jgi:hypothetical protein
VTKVFGRAGPLRPPMRRGNSRACSLASCAPSLSGPPHRAQKRAVFFGDSNPHSRHAFMAIGLFRKMPG